jgi:acyl carrier protein
MTREEIMAIVINNIKMNIDGLEETEIDPSKPLSDYGASSLDMVEIVSASRRQLRIRVARTQLTNLKNIDELVDLFTKIKNK